MYKKNLIITKNMNEADLITHSGTFHADEVFSTTLLLQILDKDIIKICRTSSKIENTNAIVYDIGYGKYDHHQPGGNGERENGIKYSSFGLVWRDFGREYLKKINVEDIDEVWRLVDKKLVQNIDSADNGQLGKITQFDFEIVTLPGLISMYNSNWNDINANQDDNFLEAVKFANIVFDKCVSTAISKSIAKSEVEKHIKDSKNQIMVLERFMPWKEYVLTSEDENAKNILFVIFPSNRVGYNVYAVPKELGSFESRKLFPESWAGLKDNELQKATGVESAIFCHSGRFICVTNTIDDAIKIAQIAVKS